MAFAKTETPLIEQGEDLPALTKTGRRPDLENTETQTHKNANKRINTNGFLQN